MDVSNKEGKKYWTNDRIDALTRAVGSAESGDPRELLENLFDEGAVYSLQNHLEFQYSTISVDDCAAIVVDAIGRLIEHIRLGKNIRRPYPYLFKIADNLALNLLRMRGSKSTIPIDFIEDVAAAPNEEFTRQEIHVKAIAVMRAIIPNLGQSNIQRVMLLYLEAFEKGVVDLTSEQVGEILGLSGASVRKCRERAFDRLERELQKIGVSLQDFKNGNFWFEDEPED